VKILDFGIAKLTGTDEEPGRTGLVNGYGAGDGGGHVGYMSPEQVRGEPVDSRSDIFNCGTVLYEMLTGRPAFARHGAEVMAAISRKIRGAASATVSPALSACCRAAWRRRGRPFQSARDLAFGLDVLTGTNAIAAVGRTLSIGVPGGAIRSCHGH
jgi:serine/threonine-protein kinase